MAEFINNCNDDALMSARDVAGQYFVEFGKKHEDVVMVNADLASACRTLGFKEEFPDRFYNVGIAEQSMVGFAAGLAHEGYRPIVTTFAPFIYMRACEQVRTDVCYGNLPIIFIGNYAGYSGGFSGATHCGLEDCAVLSSFGNMTVLEPGDPWMITRELDAAYEVNGPVYIRISKDAGKAVYPKNLRCSVGRAIITKEGDDGAFIVSGPCVRAALEASERLAEEGKNIRVVDMHTIKPIDRDAIISAAKTGHVVCAQDHNLIGGLGYAVASVIAESGISCKFKMLGAPDEFVPIASSEFLYHRIGIDADGLTAYMKGMFD